MPPRCSDSPLCLLLYLSVLLSSPVLRIRCRCPPSSLVLLRVGGAGTGEHHMPALPSKGESRDLSVAALILGSLLDGTNGLVELGFASTGLLWAWGAALYRFLGKKRSQSCPSSAACSSGGMSASE